MAKQIENNYNTVNLIAKTTKIIGDITSESDIRIDGNLQGNLKTTGLLIVGASGQISGEIECKTAEIEGVIDGKITVSELLSLKATSNLKGEVVVGQLFIEPGAIFSGNCKMERSASNKIK
ncbi:MAG TPA: polymer-forming cytoskeletal protein [Prolixibacteraceae bacterium]|nr:polymer-forming cytoskeletal protein [Prolixibacteraceae bacterium]